MREDSLQYALLKPLRDRVGDGYQSLHGNLSVLATLFGRELEYGPSIDIPLERRLWLWRRGFTSRSDALYDLDETNYRQFVSDLQHERADDIAKPWDTVVTNKLTFYLLFSEFSEHLPDLYGVVDGGEVRRQSPSMPPAPWKTDADADESDGVERHDAPSWVERYLDRREALVLKPVYGHGGRGVFVCRRAESGADGEYLVNGESKTESAFVSLLDGLEEYLAWEFAEQADYADGLYPDAVNTLRVLTMWDYEADEPFVAWAHARIGTPASAPLDNISQGGLQAGLDVDTGELLYAADITDKTSPVGLEWHDSHPATGTRIVGRAVPDWSVVADGLVRMAEGLPQFPYIGWDVLLTGDGEFTVLEVNSSPGMINTQVHSRVLDDPRVRRFYERHGVV